MQITPVYNGSPHIEVSIYFRIGENNISAAGSKSIIIFVPSTTTFTLTFNSNVISTEGELTITFIKLN